MATRRSADLPDDTAAHRRFPRATLDAAALRNNLAVVRRHAPTSRVVAAIKANGYGHGLIAVARALESADAFGVARIEEAVTLREAGIRNPIVLLEGVFSAQQLAEAAQHDLEIVVHSFEQITMLEQYAGPHRYAVWLKVDTGHESSRPASRRIPERLRARAALSPQPDCCAR